VEHNESLETRAIIGKLTDTVKNKVNNLLSNGVVTTGIVIGSVLLSRDQLLWMVDLAVSSSTNLINNSWLKIDENSTWNVLTCSSLGEECVKSIFGNSDALIARHLPIMKDSMLKAV
jgi:hypothetical protein